MPALILSLSAWLVARRVAANLAQAEADLKAHVNASLAAIKADVLTNRDMIEGVRATTDVIAIATARRAEAGEASEGAP